MIPLQVIFLRIQVKAGYLASLVVVVFKKFQVRHPEAILPSILLETEQVIIVLVIHEVVFHLRKNAESGAGKPRRALGA